MSATQVEVTELPWCQMHPADQDPVLAAYDGKTTLGPWAFMCDPCFKQYGIGLGVGRGQQLIVKKGLRCHHH